MVKLGLFVSLIAALLLAISFLSCGDEEKNGENEKKEKNEQPDHDILILDVDGQLDEDEKEDKNELLHNDQDLAGEETEKEDPFVMILAPDSGQTTKNPVQFIISAQDVAFVEIKADEWPLGNPWKPQESDEIIFSFKGTGYKRTITLIGYDKNMKKIASDSIAITIE